MKAGNNGTVLIFTSTYFTKIFEYNEMQNKVYYCHFYNESVTHFNTWWFPRDCLESIIHTISTAVLVASVVV